ncbi:MAG: tetratricopeptide repeat protein [Planctomycetes bacterium]|nr:tetratricopeptide repeat protein [Planctomycetota bacterium]
MTEVEGSPAPLQDRNVAITGRMASLLREDAITLVQQLGGTYDGTPSPDTDYLVVGEVGWPLKGDGRLTHHLEEAHRLRADGATIEVISETEFLTLIGQKVVGDLGRLYTKQQIGRILDVPAATVSAWVRQRLITPAKTVNNLEYFDFRQVASARALSKLLSSGVAPLRIRQSLRQVDTWWPGAAQTLSQLETLGHDGGIVLRLDDGTMADPSGQLMMAFDEPEGTGTPKTDPGGDALTGEAFGFGQAELRTTDEWLAVAAQFDATDRPALAIRAYQEALLTGGPNADTAFSLGNALCRLGRPAEAAQRFLQTVELKPDHVEAWNNLGNALGDIGNLGDAVSAFHKALALAPNCTDARYNLAETLYALKDVGGARRHWLRYLQVDPKSPWIDHVRERLQATK